MCNNITKIFMGRRDSTARNERLPFGGIVGGRGFEVPPANSLVSVEGAQVVFHDRVIAASNPEGGSNGGNLSLLSERNFYIGDAYAVANNWNSSAKNSSDGIVRLDPMCFMTEGELKVCRYKIPSAEIEDDLFAYLPPYCRTNSYSATEWLALRNAYDDADSNSLPKVIPKGQYIEVLEPALAVGKPDDNGCIPSAGRTTRGLIRLSPIREERE